jgi:hypothetical protein
VTLSHSTPPRSASPDGAGRLKSASPVVISTEKVCSQPLSLPRGTSIIHAAPVAGHLSSASIYPACFAPYLIVTACSDNTVRYVMKSTLYIWREESEIFFVYHRGYGEVIFSSIFV